ncbi:mucin-2-like [Ananas comosus]|uniref:Mucin-2-like n=1 Tax=Ananas comosus TaxID=4615 RepID=A0A6P5EYD7_ANACO|nr:mucin-2-like [Ananas comosus]
MEEASSSSSSSCASPRAVPWMQIAVRGVPLSASDDDLKNHFRRYGQVLAVLEDEQEMPQDSDGKQACIFFADSASANQASASREKNNHIILGKLVEVSRFSIWLQHRRIKVYNLPPGTTSSQFRAYFEEFGTVTEAVVGPDGSGYVVFKWDESLRKVLKKKLHLFYGTELKARRESWGSEAFLVANAAQHESTSSATPCAHGVAYTPTRPAYTDSTCIATTPYDALYTPSYNRPTTVVPHAYSAPTPPFGTPYESSSDNRPISVTTYAYGAPSISPYGVPATSFYNSSTTATPHVSSAPTPSFGTPYTPSDNRPISITSYAHGAPSISPYGVPSTSFYNSSTTATPHGSSTPTPPFGTPYTPSDNRPISVTTYAHGAPSISPYGVPSTSFYNSSTTATPHGSSAPTLSFGTPYTSSDNRPISVTTYAYGAPSISLYSVPATSLYNWSTTTTPHVSSIAPVKLM